MNILKKLLWNVQENRFRAGIRMIVTLLVFFLVYRGYLWILNSLGVSLFYSPKTPLWIFLLAGTVRLFPVVIAILFSGLLIDRRRIKNFGFHFKKAWWIDLLFGFSLGAILMSMIFFVELIFGWVSIGNTIHFISTSSGFTGSILVFLFYFACLGIFEELLSRGYLLKNLAEGFHLKAIGPKASVMISWFLISIIFGLAHIGNPGTTVVSVINLVLLGLTMGAGFILTGELAIPIGLHVSWNVFQGIVFGFPVSGITFPSEIVSLVKTDQHGPEIWTGGSFGPEAGLLGLSAAIIGMVLIFVWVAIRRGTRCGETRIALYP